jgi:hypothetical protein
MPLFAVTGSVDFTTAKPKRLAGFYFQNTGTAATINFRDGSATGTRFLVVPLAIGSTTPTYVGQDISAPLPLFPSGLYVEIVGGTILGSVQLE